MTLRSDGIDCRSELTTVLIPIAKIKLKKLLTFILTDYS